MLFMPSDPEMHRLVKPLLLQLWMKYDSSTTRFHFDLKERSVRGHSGTIISEKI